MSERRCSHEHLGFGGHDGAAVGVALGVPGLDQKVAEFDDIAPQVLLVDRGRRPELFGREVVVADHGIVLRPPDQDAEVVLQPVEELGELKRIVGVHGGGDKGLKELGGRGVPLLELAAAAAVRPRREEPRAAPELDEGPDGMLAGLGERAIDERARECIDRLLLPAEVGLEVLDQCVVGAVLVEGAQQLVLGRADALDLLLEAVEDQETRWRRRRREGWPGWRRGRR